MIGKINIVLGTTTSGKTDYAVELAQQLSGEIINCDSMQIYQEIPILTAQPTAQEQKNILHHLYGIINCFAPFDAMHWLNIVVPKIKETQARGRVPILVGGTGLYVKLLLEGIAVVPEIPGHVKVELRERFTAYNTLELYNQLCALDKYTAEKLKPTDRQRIMRALEVTIATGIPLSTLQSQEKQVFFKRDEFHLLLLQRTREDVYQRINARFKKMIRIGALEEVRQLLQDERYHSLDSLPKAHGLLELIKYLYGDLTLDEAIATAQQNTRHYAKRQNTWFRHQFKFDQIIFLGNAL